jgi:hypothetical protein
MGPGARPGRRGFRHCERSEAIQEPQRRAGLLRRYAPRNDVDGARHNSAFSRHTAPEFCKFIRPKKRGTQGRPGARCTRGPVCKNSKQKRTRAYRFRGNTPAFPAQWFYGLSSCSPRRDQSLLVTVAPKKRELLKDLTPAIGASGPHDFAVRTSRARQSQLSRPPLPASNVRDDRETPLLWARDSEE